MIRTVHGENCRQAAMTKARGIGSHTLDFCKVPQFVALRILESILKSGRMIHAAVLTPRAKLRFKLLSVTGIFLFATTLLRAGDDVANGLLKQAKAAYATGEHSEAFSLASQAITKEPTNALGYFVRAGFFANAHEPAKAVSDYNEALKLDPSLADAWQNRGTEHFKLGNIKESISDFDQFIVLKPGFAPYHWQRGIACYYAGRFEDGRKQFESHQTVNPNDVENAAWHFLCAARSVGVEKARAALIPIKEDARVPMMEVHALLAGKAKPEDVIKAARAGEPSVSELNRRLFYAHLYLGLYFEATGDQTQAHEHILQAVKTFKTDDYMGDVARVHLQLQKVQPPSDETKRK